MLADLTNLRNRDCFHFGRVFKAVAKSDENFRYLSQAPGMGIILIIRAFGNPGVCLHPT